MEAAIAKLHDHTGPVGCLALRLHRSDQHQQRQQKYHQSFHGRSQHLRARIWQTLTPRPRDEAFATPLPFRTEREQGQEVRVFILSSSPVENEAGQDQQPAEERNHRGQIGSTGIGEAYRRIAASRRW